MLRLIIGGVALAATGYGVKKYLEYENELNKLEAEENLNGTFDEDMQEVNKLHVEMQEVIEAFEEIKYELYRTSCSELDNAFNEMDNLSRNLKMPLFATKSNKFDFAIINNEIKETIKKWTAILKNIKSHIDIQLDNLDEILIKSSDYNTYSDEEKAKVQKLLELQRTITIGTQSMMTEDKETLTREVKRAFKKLEEYLK